MVFLCAVIILFFHLFGFRISRLAIVKKKFNDLLGFSAGLMIATALIHIFPEVNETLLYGAIFFVSGFLLLYVVENFFMIHSCGEESCNYHHLSLSSWFGIFLHSLLEGVGVGASFLIDPQLGFLVFVGIVIHEIPVSLSVFALMTHAKISSSLKNILLGLFVFSSSIGMLLGYYGLDAFSESYFVTIVVALTGGSLLYIGSSDILPMVHQRSTNKKFTTLFVLFGFLVVMMLSVFTG